MSAYYRALIKTAPAPLPFVPRKVSTAGWPIGDFTIIMACEVPADSSNYWWLLDSGVSVDYQGIGIQLSPATDYLLYKPNSNATPKYYAYSEVPRIAPLEIVINHYDASNTIALRINGGLATCAAASFPAWRPYCGVMSTFHGTDGVLPPATKFKVLSGVFTTFAAADAYVGPNLIFDGTAPQ